MFSLEPPGVEPWQYPEMGAVVARTPEDTGEAKLAPPPPPGISEAEVLLRVQNAVNEAEQRWRAQAQARESEMNLRLRAVVDAFSVERSRYFRRVEGDVVQLTLAVARKILQREAALDPVLLRGLVRVALDRVGPEESVRIRLSSEQAAAWEASGTGSPKCSDCNVIADETLTPGDCIIETDRGSVTCGIDEQLKGIEQSFCDLLARRPETIG